MRTVSFLSLILVILAGPAGLAQADDTDLRARYERAFHKETGDRDPAAALALYEQILADAESDREVAARTLLRMGFCFSKLGQTDQAIDAWKGVLIDYEDQTEAAVGAREALRDLGGQQKTDAPEPGEDDEPRGLDTEMLVVLEGAPLNEVCAILAEEGEINVVVDPEVSAEDRPVTATFRGLTIREALDVLALQQGLAWAELHGAVYLATPSTLWRYRQRRWLSSTLTRPGDAKAIQIMESSRVNLDFQEAPMETIFQALGAISGLDLNLTRDASSRIADRETTLRVQDELVRDAVRLLALPVELDYRYNHGTVVIDILRDPVEIAFDRSVSLTFDGAPLTVVAAYLSQVGSIPVGLDPEVLRLQEEEGRVVNLTLEPVPFRVALTLVTDLQDLDFAVLQGAVYIAPSAALERYRDLTWPEPTGQVNDATEATLERLKTRRIAVDFQNVPLDEVLEFVRAQGSLDLYRVFPSGTTEDTSDPRVTLTGGGLSLEQILRLALLPHDLTYTISDEGAVLVGRRQQ